MTWENGRELSQIKRGSKTWDFSYDMAGVRSGKTVTTKNSTTGETTSTEYKYTTLSGKLVRVEYNTTVLDIVYDEAGQPFSIRYKSKPTAAGTLYYYVLNAQGDVVGLLNAAGELVVEYEYDPWGKLLNTKIGVDETHSKYAAYNNMGLRNTLRYRGYIYDRDTGLYYLQSRYYDPAIGRFINADARIYIDKFFGNNQFAYCDNNPVMKVDLTGQDGKKIELGRGWYCRIDSQDTTTGTQRHIHIWNERKAVSYAQNEDGSPHDKNNNDKGKLSKWVQKAIEDKTQWDYNGNRDSFFSKTVCECGIEGTHYTFIDGVTVFVVSNPNMIISPSINSLEGIYFKSKKPSKSTINYKQMYYLPIIGPNISPSFSLGFWWGWLPFPLFA